MKRKQCPVCKKWTYKEWEGNYDHMKKISPDYGECSNCGFVYSEGRKSIDEQAKSFLKGKKALG